MTPGSLLALALALAQPPGTDRYGDPLPAGAVARIGTVRLRGPTEISPLALSPDGRVLVTGDGSRLLRVWDATAGAPVRVIPPPKDAAAN